MYAFNYECPTTLDQALALVQAGGQPLAGGQTLLGDMKLRLAATEQLVDPRNVRELGGLRHAAETLTIGAMTRPADVAADAHVAGTITALARLASGIGGTRSRKRSRGEERGH